MPSPESGMSVVHKAQSKAVATIWIPSSQAKYPYYAELMCPDRALHLVTLLPDQVTHNTAHTAPGLSWSVGNRIVASIITHPVTTSHQHTLILITSCPPDTFVS